MTEIVITGLGVTSPLGGDLPSTWDALIAGKSGVKTLTNDWALTLPVQIAAFAHTDPSIKLPPAETRYYDRTTQLALIAAQEAWEDAGFLWSAHDQVDPTRLLISVGTALGGMGSLLDNVERLTQNPHRVSPFTIPMFMPNAPAAQIGIALNAQAGVHTPISACASSNEAIALALNWLQDGRADIAVVGGTEAAINPLAIAGFAQARALSRRNDEPERASRPWDVMRDGFVMAEGAAMLVLETLTHAKARKACIYGTLAGAAINSEAFDIVRPNPDGELQCKVILDAIRSSGLSAADITHVNAHASSTKQGDLIEATSIAASAPNCLVTSTKSMTGHLLGAAGALEAVISALTLHHRLVPATINLDDPQPGLPIEIATKVTELTQGDLAVVNNSFGFGGHNVATVFTNEHANR